MASSSSGYLTINGGTIYVNASGDGLDANTSITQTGGDVTVEGPTDSANGALDYGTEYNMTGGSLVAIGSSGMLQQISDDSSETALTVVFSSAQAAGTEITLKDSSGSTLASLTTTKEAATVEFAGSGLTDGETCSLYADGTKLCDITLSGTVTTVNDSGESTTTGGMGGMQGRK